MFNRLGKRISLILGLLVAFAISSSSLLSSQQMLPPIAEQQSYYLDQSAFIASHQECQTDSQDCTSESHNHCNGGCFGHSLYRSASNNSWYQARIPSKTRLFTKTHPAFTAPAYRPPIA